MDVSFPNWITDSPLLREMDYTIEEFYPEMPPKYKDYLQEQSIGDPTVLIDLLNYLQFETIPYELLPRMVNVNVDAFLTLGISKEMRGFQEFLQVPDQRKMVHAVQKGRVDWMKYAHENGFTWGELKSGRKRPFGDRSESAPTVNGCPWDTKTCSEAALMGHLDCLKYAHENGCPWDTKTCSEAALMGHLDCLKYAHENGCPWDTKTCSEAAEGGHFDCLKYAHENGCK